MPDNSLFIKRCLELAVKGKGLAAPNPMVGAVLVHNERVIGEGFHQRYGEAHAEINCLNSVKEGDKQLIPESTMYVSLEPCSHFGKTPPCAVRLVEEKIKEVIVCNEDPFEQVSGRGFEMLNANGIKTRSKVLEQEGLWLNRRFFCFHQSNRPYIILKWAQSENGFFAPADRSRLQLSNRHSLQLVHKWRTEEAAIMVGTGTALNDDPQLTARLWSGKQPLRIVIDRELKLPLSLKIFGDEANTWIINELKESEDGTVKFIRLNFGEDILQQLLGRLHTAGMLSLIVEGGATLLNSLIKADLWDEARVFITDKVLENGVSAPSLVNAEKAFSSQVETDVLYVYTNQASRYSYVNGMEL